MQRDNPHARLGLQNKGKQICLYCPEQDGLEHGQVYLEVFGKQVELQSLEKGFFEYNSDLPLSSLDYRIQHSNGLIAPDPRMPLVQHLAL